MKPIISLSYDKYPQDELLAADMSLSQKDLIEYSKAISDRMRRIDNIRQLYSKENFNAPIYELAFESLLQEKKNYKRDFVVPFEKPLDQDTILTPNCKIRLISFNAPGRIYNTKYLKNEAIFLDYGINTEKIVSLYISKDGHFGFLIRFNRYSYKMEFGDVGGELPINDGEFKGEAYESTLVNLIMFFSSIIKNNEINIMNTIEEISAKNPSSTIAHVYLNTKENMKNIEKIDEEFESALTNSAVGKNSKIEHINAIRTFFIDEVLSIKFYEPDSFSKEYRDTHPLCIYKLLPSESEDEFNFSLRYESTNKATCANLALLIPSVVRIKDNKLYLLYSYDSNNDSIMNPALAYTFDNCEIKGNTQTINHRTYTLIEREEYLPQLKKAIKNNAFARGLDPQKSISTYTAEFENFHKTISLGFISGLKTSKRRVSLIENKLTPYEYKLKIINVLSDILVKAFTSEILIKKI